MLFQTRFLSVVLLLSAGAILLAQAPAVDSPASPDLRALQQSNEDLRRTVLTVQGQVLTLQKALDRLNQELAGVKVGITINKSAGKIDWAAVQDAFSEAVKADEAGQLAEAVVKYSTVIESDPSNDTAYLRRGTCLYRLGRLPEALVDLNEALRLQPNDGRAYTMRCDILAALDRPVDALLDLNEVIRRDTRNPENYLTRGRLLAQLGLYGPAASEYQHVLQLMPQATDLSKTQEILQELAKRNMPAPLPPAKTMQSAASSGGADRMMPKADTPSPVVVDLGASERGSWLLSGRRYLEQGKYPLAITTLTRAIDSDPKNAIALNSRGYAEMRLGKVAAAIDDFTRAIKLNPAYVNAYHNRSVARRLVGDSAGAAEDLRAESVASGNRK